MASSPLSSTMSEPESDDKGSLFEGMVLFSPQTVPDSDDAKQLNQSSTADESHIDRVGHVYPRSLSSSSASPSVPLDENLFSDLTVVPVTEAPEPSGVRPLSPSSTAVTQRQNSIRKKKIAAGLRIGYARDKDIPNYSDGLKGSPNAAIQQNKKQDQDYDYHQSSVITVQRKDGDPCRANDQIGTSLATEVADVSASPCSNGNLQGEVNEGHGKLETPCSSNSRLEEIRNHIAGKLKHAREAVTHVSAARKDSIRRRRTTAEKLSRAAAKHRELEQELEEACETEDFEKAERVSESLSSAEKDRELLVAAYKEAEAYCNTLDSKMKAALECQIQAEEECASLFQSFAADASHDADVLLENAKELSSNETEKWLSSTEEVELRKMELDIESHLVHEARLALNISIEHSVEDDQKERDLLYKRREMLREDMQKLLLMVKEKETEISENDSKIERVEERISGIIFCFQEAHCTLDTMYNDLQSALCQVELEYGFLSERKNETERLLCQEETMGEKIREISRVSRDEADMLQAVATLRKSLLKFIFQSMEDKLRLTKTEEKLSEDVNVLRQGISGARASLQELSSSKLGIQQKVESLNQRLLFADKRVPELEAEKKVAATARNFREAARIATEAKTLSIEKEGLEINIENAMLELKKLEEQICNTIKELQETESQVLGKEKELAIARCQRLILIADSTSAERSAALELGDHEEAEVLLAEAEASAAEARKLQLLYDFSDEDVANLPKHFLPMELVSKLGHKQLAELAASFHVSAC